MKNKTEGLYEEIFSIIIGIILDNNDDFMPNNIHCDCKEGLWKRFKNTKKLKEKNIIW